MVKARSVQEISLMRESGQIAVSALKKSLESVKVGISPLKIDKIAEKEIYKLGGDLSYKSVPGYNFATCITINEQVVHGIPTDRIIKEGDLVSVDLAVSFKGWHTDCAWSVLVREDGKWKMEDREKERFLKVGQEALWDGVAKAVEGNRIGDISFAIQSKVEGAGYHVVRSLVGHGIGKRLHEEPEIPCFGQKGAGVLLNRGMTLAIEVIYAKGTNEVVLGSDGWTFLSADGSWAAVFEMSVVVGKEGAEVLTQLD